jgi:hypothetical protein
MGTTSLLHPAFSFGVPICPKDDHQNRPKRQGQKLDKHIHERFWKKDSNFIEMRRAGAPPETANVSKTVAVAYCRSVVKAGRIGAMIVTTAPSARCKNFNLCRGLEAATSTAARRCRSIRCAPFMAHVVAQGLAFLWYTISHVTPRLAFCCRLCGSPLHVDPQPRTESGSHTADGVERMGCLRADRHGGRL